MTKLEELEADNLAAFVIFKAAGEALERAAIAAKGDRTAALKKVDASYAVYSRTMNAYLAELKKQTKENK